MEKLARVWTELSKNASANRSTQVSIVADVAEGLAAAKRLAETRQKALAAIAVALVCFVVVVVVVVLLLLLLLLFASLHCVQEVDLLVTGSLYLVGNALESVSATTEIA